MDQELPEFKEGKPLQPDWNAAPSTRELHQNYQEALQDHTLQMQKVQTWRDAMAVSGEFGIKQPRKGAKRSRIAPKLIRKQAEWRYPSLSEPFMSTPDLFNVRGVTHMDVLAARQNQYVLNNQFNTQINKRKFIDDLIKSVVDEGTVIVRTGWEYEVEELTVVKPVYEYEPAKQPQDVAVIQQLFNLNERSPASLRTLDPSLQESFRMSKKMGVPYRAIQVGSKQVTEERVLVNRPTVEVCNLENVVIDPTCNGDLDKAMFVVYSYETSKAELLKSDKYHNLDAVNFKGRTAGGDGDHSSRNTSSFTFADEARNKVIVYEYWGYWDVHGDGSLVPIMASYIDDVMIQLEKNPYPDGMLPFVAVPYAHVVGSVYGEADAELLIDNQLIMGAVTRGMVDLMGKSANSQQGIRKGFLDAVNKRRFLQGMNYEFNSEHPEHSVYMHKFPEIPVSAYNMLEMQNNEAESISGIKAFHSGISGQALGDTATGIRNALDATSKRELAILRRIVDGILRVGRRIIAMNSLFLTEEEVVRITDSEYVTIQRDDLAGNFDLELTISTAEADNQKAAELAFMVQTVGNKVDPMITYQLMADIADLRKMPDTAHRLRNYKPQPNPLEERKQMLEIMLLEAQIRQVTGQGQAQMATAQEKVAKANNLEADTALKQLEYLEQEGGTHHAREMELMQAQAGGNAQLEILKAALNSLNTETKEQA